MKVNSRFRPQQMAAKSAMKFRRQFGHQSWNWQSRVEWWPVGWKVNQISIARRFQRLHYLACHAPEPVQRRWRAAYKTFCCKHFAANARSVSLRYINNYTCHSWL